MDLQQTFFFADNRKKISQHGMTESELRAGAGITAKERMIALQKPWSGVRGISDVVRRLVARTMAQNFSKVEAATAPHQDAVSTRGGECAGSRWCSLN